MRGTMCGRRDQKGSILRPSGEKGKAKATGGLVLGMVGGGRVGGEVGGGVGGGKVVRNGVGTATMANIGL